LASLILNLLGISSCVWDLRPNEGLVLHERQLLGRSGLLIAYFTIYLGDAADEAIKNNLPAVSFGYEANGKVYEKKEGDRRKSCEIIHLAPSTVNFCLRRPKPFL